MTTNIKSMGCYAALGLALLVGASGLRADERDDRIEDAFKQSYVYRTQLKDTDISISSDNGVVTLKGKVDNDQQKQLAEDTARALPGVSSVDDRITVTSQPSESSDGWIATKVRGALLFHRSVSLANTKVNVSNGVVTLSGTARSTAEKDLASQYAHDVKGVRQVINNIEVSGEQTAGRAEGEQASPRAEGEQTVGHKIDDASITAQLKYALAVRSSTSAMHTHVTTQDGVVTIRGEANNQAEKDLVTKLAEDINGVKDVQNEMTVK